MYTTTFPHTIFSKFTMIEANLKLGWFSTWNWHPLFILSIHLNAIPFKFPNLRRKIDKRTKKKLMIRLRKMVLVGFSSEMKVFLAYDTHQLTELWTLFRWKNNKRLFIHSKNPSNLCDVMLIGHSQHQSNVETVRHHVNCVHKKFIFFLNLNENMTLIPIFSRK